MVTEFLVLILSICGITQVVCHPQCFDFRPPFHVAEGLSFCKEYSDFGCCTHRNDSLVEKRHEQILEQLASDDRVRCSNFIKQILCQECSPYSIHIYDAEESQILKPFAGLCTSYCEQFYAVCKDVVPYITQDTGVLESLVSAQSFCSFISLSDVDYCYPDLLTNPVLVEDIDFDQGTQNTDDCLCLEPFATGLRNPLQLRSPDDNSGRIFVGEQIGLVHIYFKNGTKLRNPFLNLTDIVLTSSWQGDERGFLGLAFHPNFGDNGKIYVYFTLRHTDGKHYTRVSELHTESSNPNRVDRMSERVLLQILQPYWNHNGGELMFGKDGYLYAFVGDGGAGGDPHGNAQNLKTLLGKVLRIDVNSRGSEGLPYAIPSDNPFVNNPDQGLPEIFAYGIRNIWRCDVDDGDPETGDGLGRIICGDVGQSKWEEIDIIENGGNYGWNSREGFECFRDELCGNVGPEKLPIHAYDHSIGKSVTGGHIYRGCMNPALNGHYIYGDYVSGHIFRLLEDKSSGTWQNSRVDMCEDDICFNGLHNDYKRNILSFGEDYDGEMYILSTSNASPTTPSGEIYRIVDPRRRGDPGKCRSEFTRNQHTKHTTAATPTLTSTTTTSSPDVNIFYPARGSSQSFHNSNRIIITFCLLISTVQCFVEYIYVAR